MIVKVAAIFRLDLSGHTALIEPLPAKEELTNRSSRLREHNE